MRLAALYYEVESACAIIGVALLQTCCANSCQTAAPPSRAMFTKYWFVCHGKLASPQIEEAPTAQFFTETGVSAMSFAV